MLLKIRYFLCSRPLQGISRIFIKKYYEATFDFDVKSGFALLTVLTLCGKLVIINSAVNKKLTVNSHSTIGLLLLTKPMVGVFFSPNNLY